MHGACCRWFCYINTVPCISAELRAVVYANDGAGGDDDERTIIAASLRKRHTYTPPRFMGQTKKSAYYAMNVRVCMHRCPHRTKVYGVFGGSSSSSNSKASCNRVFARVLVCASGAVKRHPRTTAHKQQQQWHREECYYDYSIRPQQ